MSSLHIFCETGAFGDTALNLCRCHIAMKALGRDDVIIHTSPIFKFGQPVREIPMNENVLEIYKRTKFVKDIVADVDYDDQQSLRISKKYGVPILQPMNQRDHNNIKEWVDFDDLTPDVDSEKSVLFQPISLKMKPQDQVDAYIPVWTRCLKTLIEKNYKIYMVGSEDDQIDLCVPKEFLPYIENKIGEWNILQSIAFTINKAEIILSCDSWAGLWGAGCRKKTAIAWGYRMENNIDFWVTGFLGNRDCYVYGWSSQKDYTDALLASYLSGIS
jgi:hypothetical protein